jgi:hypothetical protein
MKRNPENRPRGVVELLERAQRRHRVLLTAGVLLFATIVMAPRLASADVVGMVLNGFTVKSSIPLTGISWQFAVPGNSAPPVTITRDLDSFSPALFQAVAEGRQFRSAKITVIDTNNAKIAKFTLTSVVLTSRQVNSGGSVPQEIITMSFTQIR